MNYEQAKANYERTKADYEAAVNAWEDSRLYAPFDGYVQQAHMRESIIHSSHHQTLIC